MKQLLKYGIGCLLMASIFPIITSCDDTDISSDITEIVYPSSVQLDIPEEWQGYIYTDATGASVLPLISGQTASLGYSMPDDATYRDVVWESSNVSVATVDDKGLVTAVKGNGSSYSIISVHPEVYFSSSNGLVAALRVIVADEVNPVTSVSIDFTERDEYYEGDILTLGYTLTPSTSTYRTVKWSSSNGAIATVSSEGKVTFLATGNVTITATSMDNAASASKDFNIKKGTAPTTISFKDNMPKENLAYGQKINLKDYIVMDPADASFSMIEWSDEDGLISVDENGVLKIKYTGDISSFAMSGHTIKLTAKDRNGGELGKIDLTVAPGHFIHLFSDGMKPFIMDWKQGTVWNQYESYVHIDASESMRQDIGIANNKSGGYYLNATTYKYFAVKIRPTYWYDEANGYSKFQPGAPDGWRQNKLALNINLNVNDGNAGHQNITKQLNADGNELVDLIYDGTPKVGVLDISSVGKVSGAADLTGLVDIKNLDIIVADLTYANERTYDIYWMGTFDSLEAIKEFYEANEQ